MSTSGTRPPRVWLVAGLGSPPRPTDRPAVRDQQMRRWEPGPDGQYHTSDGRHHYSWDQLHARYDLVEDPAETAGQR